MAENVVIQLTLEQKKALDGLAKLNKKVGETQKGIKATTVALGAFAGSLAFGAFSRLNAALSASFDSFKNFEKALLEIETILPKNTKLTKELTDSISRLSGQFGTSQEKQAKAFYQTISAGITDTAKALEVLDASNRVALGGLSDIESSVDVITDILNVYGQENITAADAADILFQTVRLGKTRIEELSSSVGSVIPIAKQLNISFVEVSAALAQLTTKGQTTSERVTQLNSLFTAVIKNQDRAAEFGQKVADAFNITALKTKGLSLFLKDLIEATGGSEAVLQKLIGRTEGVKAVLGLTQDGIEGFNDTLSEFDSRAGAASDAANKIKNSLTFKLDQQTAQFDRLATKLFELTKPALISGLSALNAVLSSVTGDFATTSEFAIREVARLEERLEFLREERGRIRSGKTTLAEDLFGGKSLDEIQGDIDILTARLIELRKNIPTEPIDFSDVAAFGEGLGEDPTIGGTDTDRVGALAQEIEELNELRRQEAIFKEELALQDQDRERLRREVGLEEEIAFNEQINAAFAQREQQRQAILKANTDDQKKLAIESKKLELQSFKERLAAQKRFANSRLALERQTTDRLIGFGQALGDAIVATTGASSGTALAIQKAFAIAQILIDDSRARVGAFASTASIPFPGNVVAFGQLQSLITTNTALALGAVAAQTVAQAAGGRKAQDGGFIPGSQFAGDQVPILANSGELILNTAQQDNIADRLTGGQQGDIVIEIDGREIARTVRDQQQQGFVLT